jgi:predicted metal-dependent HD superfamily phosphohydrolase
MFKKFFFDVLPALGVDAEKREQLWDHISKQYTMPFRHYHNLHHLDNLSAELEAVKDTINDWVPVVFAIGYHDIVYDTSRPDNEQRSAEYAVKILSDFLPAVQTEKCAQLILATKSHSASTDPDINHFTDADLSILGKPYNDYRLYCEQIRKEYAPFDDSIFIPARIQVLKRFIVMPYIYKTPVFSKKYETQARKNIAEELKHLEKIAG